MSIIPTLKERRAFNEKRRRSREGVQLNSIRHPEGDGVEPEGLNPDSLETIEIEIPMTPDKILRNLENGYFMTHQEQAEAAQYIRELQKMNAALRESLIMNAEEVQRLRQQFGLWKKDETWTSE